MKFVLAMLTISVTSCASQSAKTVAQLDKGQPAYESPTCKHRMQAATKQDELKLARILASPAIVIISGGLLAGPVLAANVGLDTSDHLTASDISVACGGQPKSNQEIAVDVVKGAAFGLTTSGLMSGSAASTK